MTQLKKGEELDNHIDKLCDEYNNRTNKILYNAIKTPDGTILESKHVHDYVSYKDANGNYYAVDGGTEYLKRSCEANDYIELSKYEHS